MPLASRTQAFWKVMIWDEKGDPSPWSEPASWAMGLLQSTDWSAKWIGASEYTEPESATYPASYFRKEFSSARKVEKATIYICGLGFYELWGNGKKIGDQVLAPAVTNYDERLLEDLLYPYDDQSTQRVFYNSFDVREEIREGTKCIGVLLGNGWYNQRDRTVEPANTTATFVLPGQKNELRDGAGRKLPVEESGGKFTVEFESGIYRFEA